MRWWKYKYASFWPSFVRRGILLHENRAPIFGANWEEMLLLWGFLWDMLTHFLQQKNIHPVDSIETNKIQVFFFFVILAEKQPASTPLRMSVWYLKADHVSTSIFNCIIN